MNGQKAGFLEEHPSHRLTQVGWSNSMIFRRTSFPSFGPRLMVKQLYS